MEQIVYDKEYLINMKLQIEDFLKTLDTNFNEYFDRLRNGRYSVSELFPMFWDDNDFGSLLRTSAYVDQYKELIKKKGQKLIEEIDVRIQAFDELHKIEI